MCQDLQKKEYTTVCYGSPKTLKASEEMKGIIACKDRGETLACTELRGAKRYLVSLSLSIFLIHVLRMLAALILYSCPHRSSSVTYIISIPQIKLIRYIRNMQPEKTQSYIKYTHIKIY